MPVPRPRMRRPSASLLVAGLALFVALGGPAQAGRLISGSDIKKGTITSKQVKDRTLQTADLSPTARRAFTWTADASITAEKLGENAVTTRSLAPESVLTGTVADATLTASDLAANSVGTEEVGDNAVGQTEIRNNGVGASEIADQSIDGGEIIDGGLLARDVGRYWGTLEARFPDMPARECKGAVVTNSGADIDDADISGDLVLVSAGDNWPGALLYQVKGGPDKDKFTLYACNPTEFSVAVPPVVLFRYAIIGFDAPKAAGSATAGP